MENNGGKIIQFPQKKSEEVKTQIEERFEDHSLPSLRLIQGDGMSPNALALSPVGSSKVMVGAIFAILALSMGLNSMDSMLKQRDFQSRSLASVSEKEITRSDQTADLESRIAGRLLDEKGRIPSSVRLSRKPTEEERLRFGVLRSQYSVALENGRLISLVLREGDEGVLGSDVTEFLVQSRQLLPFNEGSQWVAENRVVETDGILEVLSVTDANGHKLGKINVKTDPYGKLKSFTIRTE